MYTHVYIHLKCDEPNVGYLKYSILSKSERNMLSCNSREKRKFTDLILKWKYQIAANWKGVLCMLHTWALGGQAGTEFIPAVVTVSEPRK